MCNALNECASMLMTNTVTNSSRWRKRRSHNAKSTPIAYLMTLLIMAGEEEGCPLLLVSLLSPRRLTAAAGAGACVLCASNPSPVNAPGITMLLLSEMIFCLGDCQR